MPEDDRSILLYTTHKAGSMFLYRFTKDVTKRLGMRFFTLQRALLRRKLGLTYKRYIEAHEAKTGCFGPIRAAPADRIIPRSLERYTILLHVRDPRDVMTSLYFSWIYSHRRIPFFFNVSNKRRREWEQAGIDKMVLEWAPRWANKFRILSDHLRNRDNVKIIRYSDMVTSFETWLDDYLEVFPVGSGRDDLRGALIDKYRDEFTVDREDKYSNKRQVTPGDHKRKLKPETIERLDEIFADVRDMYYDT